jgi:hypothetical protein
VVGGGDAVGVEQFAARETVEVGGHDGDHGSSAVAHAVETQ